MKKLILVICGLLGLLDPTSARQLQRVLLSNIKTLTLRRDLKTTHNRVPPLPQAKCVGGTAKGLYDIDVLRCKNAGSSYDDSEVEWTCTASLPAEFKIGSTDVICEGFTGPSDPYVLKGSCGVEYRLMLTRLGEGKYGKSNNLLDGFGSSTAGNVSAGLFWLLFIGAAIWMVYAAFFRDGVARRPVRGGASGGFSGGGGNDDPPPPYDYQPRPSKSRTTYTPRTARAALPHEEWRPGFWTGALGGAAAGYMVGSRGNRLQEDQHRDQGWGNGEGSSIWDSGRTRTGRSSSSNYGHGSVRHNSSGFGGTTRR